MTLNQLALRALLPTTVFAGDDDSVVTRSDMLCENTSTSNKATPSHIAQAVIVVVAWLKVSLPEPFVALSGLRAP
jgi:hypothetical protein